MIYGNLILKKNNGIKYNKKIKLTKNSIKNQVIHQ